MEVASKILSDITAYMKYAKYIPEQKRRETWQETVNRNKQMHIHKFPELKEEIQQAYMEVEMRNGLASMRSMQFAGKPIEMNPARLYNCSYQAIDHIDAFSEIMFLLLSGCGCGYSVQKHHIRKLPPILGVQRPEGRQRKKRYLVGDSIEGWADSIKVLIESYVYNKREIDFDFRDIRPKGSLLVTSGGKAPGPEPLRECLTKITSVLENSIAERGRATKLKPIEAHDILCYIAEAVLSGGIRRCLPKGTKVLTLEGYKNIQDIHVGDNVYTASGVNSVVNVFRQGVQNVSIIKTPVGNFNATRNHRMAILGRMGKTEWKTVEELTTEDQLLFFDGVISGKKYSMPKDTTEVRPVNSTTYKDIIIPELDSDLAWMLGYFHGNGYVYNNDLSGEKHSGSVVSVSGNANAPQIMERLKTQFERFGVTACIKEVKRENTLKITAHSKRLAEYFERNIKKPSTALSVPDWIMNNTTEIRGAYLAGVIDSDGSVKNRPVILVNTVYSSFAKDISSLYASFGIPTHTSITTNRGENWQDLYRVSIKEKKNKYNIYIGAYSEKGMLSQKQFSTGAYIKQDTALNIIPYAEYRDKWDGKKNLNYEHFLTFPSAKNVLDGIPIKIDEIIIDSFVEETYDIEVENDHNFFADGFLTHNSAMIALFSLDNTEMLECKFGSWWELNPQRALSNNSAVVLRSQVDEKTFTTLWEKIKASGSGEPGIFFSNSEEWGTNPCGEISLRSNQFCNLCEINFSSIVSQDQFERIAKNITFIATLQSSYTDFHYLRDIWRETTEKEALIGISITGIASKDLKKYDLEAVANVVKKENRRVAKLIGINPSSRSTTIKPSGTASIILGTSSGVHAWYDEYYWRRVRVGKGEAIYQYLSIMHPELLEDDYFKPETTAVIKVPQKAPKNAILRTESPIDTLERVKYLHEHWIKPTHKKGINSNNVSCTIQIKNNEWDMVGNWMWENKEHYNGISVLPYDSGTYKQPPFESCTKEEYEEAMEHLTQVDLKYIQEEQDNTDLQGELACSGNNCEII